MALLTLSLIAGLMGYGCQKDITESPFCEGHFRRDLPNLSVDQVIIGWPCLKNKTFTVTGVLHERGDNFYLYDNDEAFKYKAASNRVILRLDEAGQAKARSALLASKDIQLRLTVIASLDEVAEYIIIKSDNLLSLE